MSFVVMDYPGGLLVITDHRGAPAIVNTRNSQSGSCDSALRSLIRGPDIREPRARMNAFIAPCRRKCCAILRLTTWRSVRTASNNGGTSIIRNDLMKPWV